MHTKINLHPSLLLWFSILYYLKPETIVPFFLAISIHELSHLITLRLMKIPVYQISFSGVGASIETGVVPYNAAAISAAAGPIISLISAALFRQYTLFSQYNYILGLFNLLPLRPLDGGTVLFAFMMQHTTPTIADHASNLLSVITLIVLLMVLLIFTNNHGLSPIWYFLYGAVLLKYLLTTYLSR